MVFNTSDIMKIWVDGSGWNGKESKLVIVTEDGKIIKKTFKEKRTNNEMEYLAIIEALKLCCEGDIIYSDSQLVVNQIKGEYSIRSEKLIPLFLQVLKLKGEKKAKICWIPREKNIAGNVIEGMK